MTDGRRELCYKVEVANLTWRMTVWAGLECICEGLVVGEYMEVTSLHEIAEMLDSQIHYQHVSCCIVSPKVVASNVIGCQHPRMCCCKTAPTAVSDASVMRRVGASRWGYDRRVALAKASFAAWNAASAVSVQMTVCLAESRRSCNGCMRLAQWGRNR